MKIYLTAINILLVLFWKYTQRYIDLLLLSLWVAFIAFIIVYIFPKYLIMPFKLGILKGPPLVIIDILCHWLPLLYVLFNTQISKKLDYNKLFITVLFFGIYMCVANPISLYKFYYIDLGIIFFLLAFAVRLLIY